MGMQGLHVSCTGISSKTQTNVTKEILTKLSQFLEQQSHEIAQDSPVGLQSSSIANWSMVRGRTDNTSLVIVRSIVRVVTEIIFILEETVLSTEGRRLP